MRFSPYNILDSSVAHYAKHKGSFVFVVLLVMFAGPNTVCRVPSSALVASQLLHFSCMMRHGRTKNICGIFNAGTARLLLLCAHYPILSSSTR